jgi:hypothetical protein
MGVSTLHTDYSTACSFGWWLVLICSERKVLVAGLSLEKSTDGWRLISQTNGTQASNTQKFLTPQLVVVRAQVTLFALHSSACIFLWMAFHHRDKEQTWLGSQVRGFSPV